MSPISSASGFAARSARATITSPPPGEAVLLQLASEIRPKLIVILSDINHAGDGRADGSGLKEPKALPTVGQRCHEGRLRVDLRH
jgi:hypothetical protein